MTSKEPTIDTNDNKKTPQIKEIGNYKIDKELGEGTFGHVKLGIHIPTGQKVAIKILEKEKIVDQSDIERVSREIQILKLIRHPNIIQLYEIIEDDTHLYLITEYAVGGELFDHIVKYTKLPEQEACGFLKEILSGVEYVHKLNIVHRDLKPENLLLDHQKSIKIVDFGLSNTYKDSQLLKTACGSPCYAAPEMIAGKAYHGLKVDIWSCGVILYAMVCGYLPFDDPDTQTLYKKIMNGDFSIPSHVSSGAKDLILRILDTNPASRISLEGIRQHPWYQKYGDCYEPEGIVVGYHEIPVDEKVLRSVEMKFGYDVETVMRYLENNKHNKITTFYYLMLEKEVQEGYVSDQFIGSKKFKPSILRSAKNRCEREASRGAREKIKADEERRRQIEELKRFKIRLDKKSASKMRSSGSETSSRIEKENQAKDGSEIVKILNIQKFNKKSTGNSQAASPIETQQTSPNTSRLLGGDIVQNGSPKIPKSKRKISSNSNSNNNKNNTNRSKRKSPFQSKKNSTELPKDIIKRNHIKIEKRTRRPNIARLNNTTAMSFEFPGESRSPGIDFNRKGKKKKKAKKSPGGSNVIKDSRKTSFDGIMEKKRKLKQKLISNKMREIKKNAMTAGRKRAKNKSYNFNLGGGAGNRSPKIKKKKKKKRPYALGFSSGLNTRKQSDVRLSGCSGKERTF